MINKVLFKIQRFDKNKDKKPYFKEYAVDYDNDHTVLDALIHIKEKVDPSLGFRHSCMSGICGSCSLRINGRARLGCKTLIKNELCSFREIKVEPIGNLQIKKDLIVNMEPFYAEMKAVKPWFDKIIESDKEHDVKPDDLKRIEKSSECIWCGACFSDCPSRDLESKYLGPAASVLAQRYIDDIRDSSKRERLKALVEKHIWMCMHCEKASENCPQDIEVQDVISDLRRASIKEGFVNNDGARHAKTLTKHVRKKGEIIESQLPVGAWGIFRSVKMIPLGIKLLLRGNFPPLFIKNIKGFKEWMKTRKK